MKSLLRGLAALSMLAVLSPVPAALAQDRAALSGERDKVSYMVGMDVAGSIAPAGPDLDLAAFERAVRNAFDGGKPLLTEAEAQSVGPALMQRIALRNGQPVPGMAPGAGPPPVAKDKVGFLVGADVGRSLAPIREEIDLPVFLRGLADVLQQREPLLAEAEANALRQAFSTRVQARMQAEAAAASKQNAAEGTAFLVKNQAAKGVFTTPSGLQYMVLRQGAGQRPQPDARVRVHYHGTRLDGTVFDSSYERGQPAEFGLGEVIAGWTEGVAMMPVGAKYRFWIPSDLAYGDKGSPGGIGPNSTLTFDVELLEIL
ncbi:MAG: FKBP-type peptidyl-prolyl cis-trans isomerase N-terminal domain-containing protein [Luteimonas sp.]